MDNAGIAAAVDQWIATHEQRVIEWRRHLHAHPELSNEEVETTNYLVETLESFGLKPVRFPGTGLYVDLGPVEGKRLAFRADIDALGVPEQTGLSFASVNPGVSHSCGHDVHTTIALALACALSTVQDQLPGGVRIIFQPAEEVMGGGAIDVVNWGGLEDVAAIYAVHAEPHLRVGEIGVRAGAITSASDVVRIEVQGPGGHTSRPQLTADVVYAMGALITQLPALLSRRVDPRTGTVLVFGHAEAGDAANAIPKRGALEGTLRTADIGTWRELEELITDLIDLVVAPTGCTYHLDYIRGANWKNSSRISSTSWSRRPDARTTSTTSVACRRCSTTTRPPPSPSKPDALLTRTRSSPPRSPAAERTSPGTSSTCRAR